MMSIVRSKTIRWTRSCSSGIIDAVTTTAAPVATGRLPHRAAFWTTAAVFLAAMAFTTIPTPLYALYQQRDGFPTWVVTLIFAAYAAGVALSLYLVGHVSDWVGRNKGDMKTASQQFDFGLRLVVPIAGLPRPGIAGRRLLGPAVAGHGSIYPTKGPRVDHQSGQDKDDRSHATSAPRMQHDRSPRGALGYTEASLRFAPFA